PAGGRGIGDAAAIGGRAQRAGHLAARPHRHPPGHQGDRRPASRDRGAVMAGIDPANGAAPARLLQVRQQAEELEGVFLTMLTKEMFASVKPNEALGGGGFGEETWRSMQAEQLADAMARAGGIGIADDLVR